MFADARDTWWLRATVLGAAGLAWVAMLALPEASCHCHTRAAGITLAQLVAAQSPAALAKSWGVMLLAMMAPMTLPGLYHIRASSVPRRRLWSYALFSLGYAACWMAAGAAIVAIQLLARWVAGDSLLPAVVVGAAALVWQASPLKQRALNRCHRLPSLSAFGLAASRDALAAGLSQGAWCVVSCWLLMLLPMVLSVGHFPAMAAVAVLMVCERLDPPAVPAWRLRGLGTAARWCRTRWFGPPGSAPPLTGAPGKL